MDFLRYKIYAIAIGFGIPLLFSILYIQYILVKLENIEEKLQYITKKENYND